jgi:hypothetical protein
MIRKFAGALIVLVLVGSIAAAETLRGLITKVDKTDGVTIIVREKGKKGKGEEKTYKFAATYKVLKIKGKDDTEKAELSDITKAIESSKAKRKGVFGTIEVTDDKVTEVKFGGGGIRKKKKADTE